MVGYCWRTQKCRSLCIPHAFLEGKKAGEAYASKSSPGTLKKVRQQYLVVTMVKRPMTATPAGRQRLCTVKPPRCALRAMPAANRTMVQSTQSASSHASPSAGNAASTKGKTAQCTAQASDADIPARSKTATDCTS